MPLSFLIKYLESSMNMKIILIGIQPKSMDLGPNHSEKNLISRESEEGIEKFLTILQDVL